MANETVLDTPPIFLPLLLREKEIPIDLLCTKGPRDVKSYRDSRNPKVTRKSSAEHIHGRMSSLEELFRKRRVCDDVREVRRSEPFDVAGAEIPKNGTPVTKEAASALVRDIMSNPVRVDNLGKYTDIYNAAGQGVRLEKGTNDFVTFLEGSKAHP